MIRFAIALSIVLLAGTVVSGAAGQDGASKSDDELNIPIEILDDRDQKIGELPAERVSLPDFNNVPRQRGDAKLGVTKAGHIYVAMWKKLYWTQDEGRTWQGRDLPVASGGFGVLRDDTFIVFTGHPHSGTRRSTDYGRSWSEFVPLDFAPYATGGGGWTHFHQLPDGTALMTVTLRYGDGAKDRKTQKPLPPQQLGLFDHIFRSTNSGKTWGDRSLIVPDSAESSVIRLKSGKMLAAIRKQRHPQRLLPTDDVEKLKAIDAWRNGMPYIKHGFLADSDDNGYTWKNERPAPAAPSLKHGLCPSEFVQLSDERVVWIYTHRYGKDSGVMARVSRDDGMTWSVERYRIRHLKDKDGTYPTSTVLNDGTILTVCGKNRRNLPIAIRWQLPKIQE